MPNDPTHPIQPEYLGDRPADQPEPARGRRTVVLGVAAVAVAGAVAAGAWAAVSLMSGGTQPAEAIPANALGYAGLDLDPSATQKIEAIKILRKLPAIEKNLEISSQDDLRRWVFEQAQKDGECQNLDYDRDVEPWIGDRIAFAAVPAEKPGTSPTPLVALQVTDTDAAPDGIAKLLKCDGEPAQYGVAMSGDYALISDSQKRADALAAQAERSPLAEDASFQKWTSRVGDPGILTMYAAPGAMDALVDMEGGSGDAWFAYAPDTQARSALRMQARMSRMNEQLKSLYDGFQGMAGVVRFQSGAVEAEFAGLSENKQLGLTLSPGARTDIGELPSGTAVAIGLALPKRWGQDYLDLMAKLTGDERSTKQMIAQTEAQTGLQLPQDVERLLGEGVAVALGQDLDVRAASQDPTTIPAGVRVSGNPQEIQAAVDKVKKAIGPDGDMLVSEPGDHDVALGLREDYVRTLAGRGSLSDQAAFRDVVPDAEKAAAAVYVDLDAVQRWLTEGMQEVGTPSRDEIEVRDNLAPLRAFGMSSWVEDDKSQHMRLRLTTD